MSAHIGYRASLHPAVCRLAAAAFPLISFRLPPSACLDAPREAVSKVTLRNERGRRRAQRALPSGTRKPGGKARRKRGTGTAPWCLSPFPGRQVEAPFPRLDSSHPALKGFLLRSFPHLYFFRCVPPSHSFAAEASDRLRHQAAPFGCSRTSSTLRASGLAFFASGPIYPPPDSCAPHPSPSYPRPQPYRRDL